MKISVIGAGAWGTALAQVFAKSGREIKIHAQPPNDVNCSGKIEAKDIKFNRIDIKKITLGIKDQSDLISFDIINLPKLSIY